MLRTTTRTSCWELHRQEIRRALARKVPCQSKPFQSGRLMDIAPLLGGAVWSPGAAFCWGSTHRPFAFRRPFLIGSDSDLPSSCCSWYSSFLASLGMHSAERSHRLLACARQARSHLDENSFHYYCSQIARDREALEELSVAPRTMSYNL